MRDAATIFIPICNEREAIAGALRGLVERGYHERQEIIVVDEGSTDGSGDAVATFAGVGLGIAGAILARRAAEDPDLRQPPLR